MVSLPIGIHASPSAIACDAPSGIAQAQRPRPALRLRAIYLRS